MKKYFLSILLMLSLLTLTYFLVLRDCDFNLLFTTIHNTNHFFLLGASLCMVTYLFLGSLYYKRILSYFEKKVSYYQALGYNLTEVYFSAITPSYVGGQPIQMIEMKKDDVPYEASSVIALLYSMLGRIALLVLASCLFICYYKYLFSLNTLYNVIILIGFLSTILVSLLFAGLIYSKTIANAVLKFCLFVIDKFKFFKDKDKKKERIKNIIKEYQACAKITKDNPKIIIEAFFIILAQRFVLLLTSYMVYLAFGFNKYSMFLVIAFQICVTLGSDLMPTPGGVLVNESLLLTVNQLLYGEDFALAGMLLLRSINFYLLVIVSGIFYLIFHYRKKKSK